MKKVILIGSGAVAAEITSFIEDHNQHVETKDMLNIIGYLDFNDNIDKYWQKYGLKKPVISDIYTYDIQAEDNFIISVADLPFRFKMIEYLISKNASIINFIHYTTMVGNNVEIGKGNIIYPHCLIGPKAQLGDYNLITSYSFISHDCKIGTNNFFATSGLSGHVVVGDNNVLGIRSTILHHISIGSGNTIQAGMIVDKNVKDNTTVFYRYKEQVIAIPKAD